MKENHAGCESIPSELTDPPIPAFSRNHVVYREEGRVYLSYYLNDLTPKILNEKVPSQIPYQDQVILLLDLHNPPPGSWRRLLIWCGVRYSLLLEHNSSAADCKENNVLRKLWNASDREGRRAAQSEAMHLFWPFLEKDFRDRLHCTMGTLRESDCGQHATSANAGLSPMGSVPLRQHDSAVNMKVTTVQGELKASTHNQTLDNYGKPIKNPCPNVPVFKRSQMEVVKRIHDFMHKVRIGGEDFCLKRIRFMDEESFLRDLNALHAGIGHPNFMKLSGVLEAGDGLIDGFLTPFHLGATLEHVKLASDSEKNAWKGQVQSAIRFLHKKDVVWQDAKPDNIFVTRNKELYLFDFDGGGTVPYLPPAELYGTKEGDLYGVQRILEFIENIPSSREAL